MVTKVLLVEDQQLVRTGIRMMLHIAEPRCHIVEAGSHEEAIQRMAEHDFEVVFLDIDLRSEMSGIETLAAIRDAGRPVKVVMLSGRDDPVTVMQCISAGASGFITKGQGDESVFGRALATIFNGGVYLPSSIVGSNRLGSAGAATDLGHTPRQCEVLYYVCQGLPNKSIANRLGISEGTVRRDYVSDLLRFFKVARRTELIVEVARRGITIPPPRGALAPPSHRSPE
jgi:two-component system nitrate/nitrite response regulator NarL